ncbi:MAG TPA: hypothetical protein VGD80_00335 [Kofleriaceae bacterium]
MIEAIGDVQCLDPLCSAVDGVNDIAREADHRADLERSVDDDIAAVRIAVAHPVASAAAQHRDHAVHRVGVELDDLRLLGRARRVEDDARGHALAIAEQVARQAERLIATSVMGHTRPLGERGNRREPRSDRFRAKRESPRMPLRDDELLELRAGDGPIEDGAEQVVDARPRV